jgi:hypothetical protein
MVRAMPRHRVASAIVVVLAACSSGPGAVQPQPPTGGGARPSLPVTDLAVPRGKAPVIDGVVDTAEWGRSAVVSLDHGVNLRVVHDGAKLYLAISGLDVKDATAFGCVLVATPDFVVVHHASAKLGTAVYMAAADGAYQPQSKTYAWREPEDMLREEGWMANTVGPDRKQQEFAFTFATLGLPGEPRPIAVGYIYLDPEASDLSTAGVVTWPTGLTDGAADVQLLGGFNPDSVRFEPTRWIKLHVH